jgi:hypothetical protein
MPKPKKEQEVASVLSEIDTALKRQNSIVYIFLHGFVRGMGTALGATVLVALITSLTLHFAQSPQAESFLRSLTNFIIE